MLNKNERLPVYVVLSIDDLEAMLAAIEKDRLNPKHPGRSTGVFYSKVFADSHGNFQIDSYSLSHGNPLDKMTEDYNTVEKDNENIFSTWRKVTPSESVKECGGRGYCGRDE